MSKITLTGLQVQRAEGQGQRPREHLHLRGDRGEKLGKGHEKECLEMEGEPQEKWHHGNQGGERKERGIAQRAGVSGRGDQTSMLEGGDVCCRRRRGGQCEFRQPS